MARALAKRGGYRSAAVKAVDAQAFCGEWRDDILDILYMMVAGDWLKSCGRRSATARYALRVRPCSAKCRATASMFDVMVAGNCPNSRGLLMATCR